jgi:hypothetical protein
MDWEELHHKRVVKRNGKSVKVSFAPVYVDPLLKFQNVIQKSLLKDPTLFGAKRGQALSWVCSTKQRIPLWAIKRAADALGEDYLQLIDNETIYSSTGRGVVFRNEMTLEIAYLIGLIITDGHIRANRSEVSIAQSNREMLEKVSKVFAKAFGVRPNIVEGGHNKSDLKLVVYSSALRVFLSVVWGLPIGEKSYDVSVPHVIAHSARAVQMAFVAGCVDGDGSVSTTNSYKNFLYPRIAFKCGSKNLVDGLWIMLQSLGYSGCRTLEQGKVYGTNKSSGNLCYGFEVRALRDVAHLAHEIIPHMLSRKKDRLLGYLKQSEYSIKYRVKKDEKLVQLIRRAREKKGGYPKLATYIARHTRQKVTSGGLRQYGCLSVAHNPSLATVACVCSILGEDAITFLDSRTGLLLSL